MLFNSFSYLLFLPIIFGLYWTAPVRYRKILLLVASYFFYMSWKPAYGVLIAALTAVNYGLGLAIDKHRAKSLLLLGLIFNLGALCYFKYTDFLLGALFSLLASIAGLTHIALPTGFSQPVLDILLPLGISFFAFEFIHYIVDVYRGDKPVKNPIDFALFAAFFPSQIAGPIKRYQDFMRQMEVAPVFKSEQFRQGMFLILQGLFKKVALGDNLSSLVAFGFADAGALNFFNAWITVIAFSYQLYFDFSGYTDIGRGSAMVLGYKVPENFNLPFLAASLTDFWRRWHISLSSWLRDYLFIPLGGSKNGAFQTNRNLILTMVLGGLWHGASWHFVAWGALHGLGLTVCKQWSRIVAASAFLRSRQESRAWHITGVILTNIFVYLAFAVFRAADLQQAATICAHCLGFATGPSAVTGGGEVTALALQSPIMTALPLYIIYSACRLAIDALTKRGKSHMLEPLFTFWEQTPAARISAYACVFLAIIGFAPSQGCPFIYFQF